MQIHDLKLNTKRPKKKTVGRGGKKGTYSGRGCKGQKARSGASIDPLFEGGRSTLIDHMKKKRGFTSIAAKVVVVRIDVLEENFKNGDVINPESLLKNGLIRKSQLASKIKILGNSSIKVKLTIAKNIFVSTAAKGIIEKAGGRIE